LGAAATRAIRSVIDGAESALRKVMIHVEGTVDEYDLQAQQLAFNSIEMAFQPVPKGQSDWQLFESRDEVLPVVSGLFIEGFKWLGSNGTHKLKKRDEKIVLAAIRELTPTQGGPFTSIEVSGRVVPDGIKVPLTVDSRRQLTARIRMPKPGDIKKIGRIRKIDIDQKTFDLRDLQMSRKTPSSFVFIFDEEHRADVYRHLEAEDYVQVSGSLEKSTGRYRLVDLIDAPPPA
jgi:hypothetical protein